MHQGPTVWPLLAGIGVQQRIAVVRQLQGAACGAAESQILSSNNYFNDCENVNNLQEPVTDK